MLETISFKLKLTMIIFIIIINEIIFKLIQVLFLINVNVNYFSVNMIKIIYLLTYFSVNVLLKKWYWLINKFLVFSFRRLHRWKSNSCTDGNWNVLFK